MGNSQPKIKLTETAEDIQKEIEKSSATYKSKYTKIVYTNIDKYHKQVHDGFQTEFNHLFRWQKFMKKLDENFFYTAKLYPHLNRYNNIMANEHSRIKLLKINEGSGVDYINANLVPNDAFGTNDLEYSYISTQAPLPHTFEQFWTMILQFKVPMIVMVTSLEQGYKKKADQYWPDKVNQSISHGNVQVTLLKEDSNPIFVERQLQLETIYNDVPLKHTVTQIQYVQWPDFGVPKSTEGIRALLKRMNILMETSFPQITLVNQQKSYKLGEKVLKDQSPRLEAGTSPIPPVVVHCSAGIGRTGTFIAIHCILQQLLNNNVVKNSSQPFVFNVFRTVQVLKKQRIGMVQTKQQYDFIFRTIIDEITAQPLLYYPKV